MSSYNSDDSYVAAASVAGPSRPRFNGWLTMAPEVDAASTAPAPPPVASCTVSGISSSPSRQAPSTHGFAIVAQAMPVTKKQKRGASFQIGSPDSTSVSPPGSIDSQGSNRSGRSDDSDDPLFDVRASFAPMPAYKAKAGPPKLNGGGGIQYGGVEWKGKTVHAVEQEMEQLGDTALLSHAPDATYLASRLEGLRRNLEIEAFQPRWIGDDDEYSRSLEASPPLASLSQSPSVGLSQPLAIRASGRSIFQADDQEMADAFEGMPALSHNPSAPVSNASSVSLVDEPDLDDLTMEYGFTYDEASAPEASAAVEAALARSLPVEIVSPDAPQLPELSAPLDPAAKAAALDARIEVRPLRRADLEQVRELHVFHGDADRSPEMADNYTTTASFLLRLLVDDRHVCLVAVAKPIPEPADPLPSASDLNRARQSNQMAAASFSSISSLSTSPARFTGPMSAFDPRSRSSHSGASSSLLGSGAGTPTDSLFSAVQRNGRLGPGTEMTGATSVYGGTGDDDDGKFAGPSGELPGPTESIAPPSVVRVMAAPPPKGSTGLQTETIVGVISAQIAAVQAPVEETLWLEDEAMRRALSDSGSTLDGSVGAASRPAKRAAVEAHLLTLAVAPSERSQGLGKKLIDSLLDECIYRAKVVRRKLSPSLLGPGDVSTLRTYLEVHPSNAHALDLYRSKGFERAPGERGTRRSFYRGDTRIPLAERVKTGGTDAWVLERFVD